MLGGFFFKKNVCMAVSTILEKSSLVIKYQRWLRLCQRPKVTALGKLGVRLNIQLT